MTPLPSQTPISHESGTSSAGRSTSSSNTSSALAAEEVVEHDDRDAADRERRKTEQADEEELERQHHGLHSSRWRAIKPERAAPPRAPTAEPSPPPGSRGR